MQIRFRAAAHLSALTCAAVLLAGCASSAQNDGARYYLLSDGEPQSSTGSCDLHVASVRLPTYLQRSNIIVQTSENTLHPAANHRWSEPLEQGIARTVEACLGHAESGRPLHLSIQHFHGSTEGELILQSEYSLNDSDYEFRTRTTQAQPGYEALITAHRDALRALCSEIRAQHCGG